jgi:hypothetical protein
MSVTVPSAATLKRAAAADAVAREPASSPLTALVTPRPPRQMPAVAATQAPAGTVPAAIRM